MICWLRWLRHRHVISWKDYFRDYCWQRPIGRLDIHV